MSARRYITPKAGNRKEYKTPARRESEPSIGLFQRQVPILRPEQRFVTQIHLGMYCNLRSLRDMNNFLRDFKDGKDFTERPYEGPVGVVVSKDYSDGRVVDIAVLNGSQVAYRTDMRGKPEDFSDDKKVEEVMKALHEVIDSEDIRRYKHSFVSGPNVRPRHFDFTRENVSELVDNLISE